MNMDWAILILRLGLGIMFFMHGLQMVFGKLGGSGVAGFSKMLSGMSFKPPLFWAYLACYSVLIGGAFLVLGVFVRLSALVLLIFISVAAVKAHLPSGFFNAKGGFEYNFIIAVACLSLIVSGPGYYALVPKF